jgi:hypothetical protein
MCHLVICWNLRLGFQIDLLGVPCGKSIHVFALILGLGLKFHVNHKVAITINEMLITSAPRKCVLVHFGFHKNFERI